MLMQVNLQVPKIQNLHTFRFQVNGECVYMNNDVLTLCL